MEEIIIQQKRSVLGKHLFISILFIVIAYFLYIDKNNYYPLREIGSIACMIFFGFTAIVFFIKIIILKPLLIVKPEGLYYQEIFIPWSEINDFSLFAFRENFQYLKIHINNYSEVVKQFSPTTRRKIELNKKYSGETLMLSLSSTGLKPLEVLQKLKDYLALASNL